MPRRLTPSQARNLIRQAQQKHQQAVRRLESDLRRQHQRARQKNQQVRTAVNRLNSEIRGYNARVKANQRAVDAAWSRLKMNTRSARTATTVTYRSSAVLHESYLAFSEKVDSQQLGPTYIALADLAEREVANDLIVTNTLFGDPEAAMEPVIDPQDAELVGRLQRIDPDLDRRWRGAVFALNPENPDAVRHFCVSSREVVAGILDALAPVDAVLVAKPDCTKTRAGLPVRRERLFYMLRERGTDDDALLQFVEDDVSSVISLVDALNDGTHGATDAFGAAEFAKIQKRVEDSLTFLTILGTTLVPGRRQGRGGP